MSVTKITCLSRCSFRRLLPILCLSVGALLGTTRASAAVHPSLFVSATELSNSIADYQLTPSAYASLLPNAAIMSGTPVSFTVQDSAHHNPMRLAWIAAAYRYTGNSAYITRLRDWITTMDGYTPPVMTSIGSNDGLNKGHILLGLSLVYDLLKGQPSVSDVTDSVQACIVRTANQLLTDLDGLYSKPYEQNHFFIPACGLSIAAMVLDGEEADATDWAAFADAALVHTYASISYDGWYSEGISYWNYSISFPVLQALASDRIRSTSFLQAAPFVKIPEYVGHMLLPNNTQAFDFADWGAQPGQQGYDWTWHSYPTDMRMLPLWTLQKVRSPDTFLNNLVDKLADKSSGIDALEKAFQLLWLIPPAPLENAMGDHFERYVAGSTLTTPWTSVTATATNKVEVIADSTDIFGDGPDNRILHILDNSASALTRADLRLPTGEQVVTLSFELVEKSGVTGTPFRVSLGGTSTSNTAFRVNFSEGSPGTYSLNAVHRVVIVANTSAANVPYNNSLNQVDSMECDVWIDNVLVSAGQALLAGSTYTAGTPMEVCRFATDSGGLSQEVYIDNLLLESGATYEATPGSVPPPSPNPYAEAPFRYFDDAEVVHWRTAWDYPGATALAFKSGPPAGHNLTVIEPLVADWKPSIGHPHPDAGSFLLWSNGVFLANDTGYTGAKETADHNSILIDGVGQHEGGTAWYTFTGKTLAEYDDIRMEDVWLSPAVAASSAEFTAAYVDTLEMDSVRRDLILVAGRYMLVHDRLQSSEAHDYQWRLHMDREPVSTGTGRFLMDNGAAALAIQPLSAISSTSIAPTVVETALNYPTSSLPQQRGYHLAQVSPNSANFDFVTALGVLAPGESEAAFTATKIDSVCVQFTDANQTCLIWTGSNADFTGRFAFVLRNNGGALIAAGMLGESLSSGTLTMTTSSAGRVTVQRDSSNVLRIVQSTAGGLSVVENGVPVTP